jgi:hypothetical protein
MILKNIFYFLVEIKITLCYNQIRSVVKKQLAVVAELAYALDSGSSEGFLVGVQVPSTALLKNEGFQSF